MYKPNILLTALFVLGLITISTAQTLPSYLPTDGLAGWWPFNGNANDESGIGNNGTAVGAYLTNDRFGNFNGAYRFNGNNEYIQLSSTFFDGLQVPEFTIHTSFKVFNFPNSQGYGQNIWGKNYSWGEVNIEIHPDSSLRLFFANNFSGNKISTARTDPGTINSNQWLTVSIVYQNSNVSIYVNSNQTPVTLFWGSQYGTVYSTTQIESVCNFAADANTYRFGTRITSGAWGSYFNGIMDDFGIWNRALTHEEITALQTGVPSDNNGGGSSATMTVPDGISYQAVARNAQGQPFSDAAVQVRFTLLTDSLTGSAEYSESHALTTNSLGLFTTAFGTGTPLSGTFAGINWAGGNKYLQVEIDAGNGFVDLGAQQLLSVPYALQAKKSTLIENNGLPVYSNNAEALAGGLVAGQMYRTSTGDLKIVY